MPLFAQMGKEPLVWDPQKDRLAARFSSEGVFNTNSKRIAKLLRDLGYQEVAENEVTGLGLTVPKAGIVEKQPLSPGAGYRKVEVGKTVPVYGGTQEEGFDQEVTPKRSLR